MTDHKFHCLLYVTNVPPHHISRYNYVTCSLKVELCFRIQAQKFQKVSTLHTADDHNTIAFINPLKPSGSCTYHKV